MALEIKGGMRPAMYETVIITRREEDRRTPCTLGQAWLQEWEQHHLQNLWDLT